jgi:amino acid permease
MGWIHIKIYSKQGVMKEVIIVTVGLTPDSSMNKYAASAIVIIRVTSFFIVQVVIAGLVVNALDPTATF